MFVGLCKFLRWLFCTLNLQGRFMGNFWTIAVCQYITLIKNLYVNLININLYKFDWVTPKNLAQLIAWFLASHLKGKKKAWNFDTLNDDAKHSKVEQSMVGKKIQVNKDVVHLLYSRLWNRRSPWNKRSPWNSWQKH